MEGFQEEWLDDTIQNLFVTFNTQASFNKKSRNGKLFNIFNTFLR